MSKEENFLLVSESGESEEKVVGSIFELTTRHVAIGARTPTLLQMTRASGKIQPLSHGLSTLFSCVETIPALSFRQHTRRASDSFRTDMRITAGFSCTHHATGREAH